jgi:hypothetical protein
MGDISTNNKAPRHAGGAPTKYRPEYCQQIVDFFTVNPTTEEIASRQKGNGLIRFPTFEGFASSIHVVMSTLFEWCKEHKEFSNAYNECKQLQKQFLIDCSLNDVFNAGFAKFVAINCTDMKEKLEQDVHHSGLPEPPNTISVRIVESK